MAAAANIVLADALATPVSHTFIPVGPDPKDPSVFWFEDQSQSSAIGFWHVSIQLKRPAINAKVSDNPDQRTSRVVIGLHEPVLEVLSNSTVSGITPAPTLSYIPRCFTEYVVPERSVLQNRKDLRKMNYNLQNDPAVVNAVELLQAVW